MDVYQDVTDRMVAALERGTVPWHRPWSASSGGRPRSMSTGRPYSGINTWLLGLAAFERGYTSPWWGTFRQVKALGGTVRKGQNAQNGCGATHIVFWKAFTPKDARPDRTRARPARQRWPACTACSTPISARACQPGTARSRAPSPCGSRRQTT